MSVFTGNLTVDILGIIVALLAVLYAYIKWSFRYWKVRNVPYLEPTVPFGNLQPPYGRTMSLGDEITNMYKIAKSKGSHSKYYGVYLLAKPSLMLMDMDLVKNVMTKDFQHFTDRGTYVNEKDDPMSAHLFAIGGSKWKNLRTKFTPTFTTGKLRGMFQTLIDTGVELEKYLAKEVEAKRTVDIKHALVCFTIDVIGNCAFGIKLNNFNGTDFPFHHFGKRILEKNTIETLIAAFADNFPDLARALGVRSFPKDASSFFIDLVEKTVKYREENNVVRNDFLQLLLDIKRDEESQAKANKGDGHVLTMNEIVAQSFVIFVGGFETSSTTMTFTLYELALNQDIQNKVREELKRVLKKYDNQISYDSLKELHYMGQVIDETLRKYPPVPFLTRECIQSYKVPDSDLIIEKGMLVTIPIRGFHHDGDFFENPQTYDPERFNENEKNQRQQYSYLPFGEGPRICIGKRFGLMQTRVGLANILNNYKVKLNEKTKVPLKMNIKSFVPAAEGSVWLDLERV